MTLRADVLFDMGNITRFADTVDDDEQIVATVPEYQVVDDAARGVEQQAVALFADREVDHIDRHQSFKRGRRVAPDESQLAHVRHVEQSCRVAGVMVLSHQAHGILNRHGIAGKRYHARAQLDMQCMQRRLEKIVD